MLTMPSLQVQAPVEPVDTQDGVLGVPQDVNTVGWWSAGAAPGAASGSVVIDGHIDAVDQGPGAFFRLGDLNAGDRVTVAGDDGSGLTYQVDGRRTYSKNADLPADLFSTDGPARLVLITCGGDFDSTTLSYASNIVIFASPVS